MSISFLMNYISLCNFFFAKYAVFLLKIIFYYTFFISLRVIFD